MTSSLGGLVIGMLLGALLVYAVAPRASKPASVATMVAAPPTTPTSPDLRELETQLAGIPGLLVSRQDHDVVVAPTSGGFATASANPDAATVRLLAGIAAAVGSGPARLRIEIRGHTDATTLRTGAPWRDNWSLGLARAEAVAQALRKALPDDPRRVSLAVSSRGELPPELPGATPRRTVVLRFSLEP